MIDAQSGDIARFQHFKNKLMSGPQNLGDFDSKASERIDVKETPVVDSPPRPPIAQRR
jgi:hypothetical protein